MKTFQKFRVTKSVKMNDIPFTFSVYYLSTPPFHWPKRSVAVADAIIIGKQFGQGYTGTLKPEYAFTNRFSNDIIPFGFLFRQTGLPLIHHA